MDFTHLNDQGRALMVDVTEKAPSQRRALAEVRVLGAPATLAAIRSGGVRKGDVLAVAQVAGIQAAKHCWELIPLCHPLPLSGVDIHFTLSERELLIRASVRCQGPTGVEMEALCAASVAALTVYDMCKALQKDMEITGLRLLEKDGGKSGPYRSPALPAQTPGQGVVAAVCVSARKGTPKEPVPALELRVGQGILGDAHGGNWHRQVSLLAQESVDKMAVLGLELAPGAFAENILTRGLELKSLPVGTVLRVGTALLAVTQIGKECHSDCAIKQKTGKCVMPTEGVFALVLKDGAVKPGDSVRVEGLS